MVYSKKQAWIKKGSASALDDDMQMRKKPNFKILLPVAGLIVVVMLVIFFLILIGKVIEPKGKNAISISAFDGDTPVQVALVRVDPDGYLRISILNEQSPSVEEIRRTFEELRSRQTLSLVLEDMLPNGTLITKEKQVMPSNPDYIYALAEAFRTYGFEVDLIYLPGI